MYDSQRGREREISSYLDSPQVDVLQQSQSLHLGFHMDAHVLDVFDFLVLRVVRNDKQVLLLFFLLLNQLPGHDPGSEGQENFHEHITLSGDMYSRDDGWLNIKMFYKKVGLIHKNTMETVRN